MKRAIGFSLFMMTAVAIGFLVGNGVVEEKENEITFGEGAMVSLTAEKLLADFEASELMSVSRYVGKLIEVTGVVEAYGENQDGSVFITLSGAASGEIIKCSLVPGTVADTGNLVRGSSIIVTGFCEGKTEVINIGYCTVK